MIGSYVSFFVRRAYSSLRLAVLGCQLSVCACICCSWLFCVIIGHDGSQLVTVCYYWLLVVMLCCQWILCDSIGQYLALLAILGYYVVLLGCCLRCVVIMCLLCCFFVSLSYYCLLCVRLGQSWLFLAILGLASIGYYLLFLVIICNYWLVQVSLGCSGFRFAILCYSWSLSATICHYLFSCVRLAAS